MHTPGKNLSLREIFPEVPGAPAGGGAKGRPSRAHFHRCACACSTARRRAFRTASLRRRCLPTSRRAQRALFEELGRGSMGMNEFHYSINISFVPALSPVCPRLVPGSHSPQTRMAAGFLPFVPVSPALLALMVPKEMQKATHAPMKKGPRGPLWCGAGVCPPGCDSCFLHSIRFQVSSHAARVGIFTTLPALRPSR